MRPTTITEDVSEGPVGQNRTVVACTAPAALAVLPVPDRNALQRSHQSGHGRCRRGLQSQLLQITPGASLHGNGKFSVGADSNSWFATKNGDGTNIFTTPAPGTFTAQRNRNILVGPGSANYNVSLQKRVQTFENQSLTFRFDVFDFPNHPNLSAPDSTYTDTTFGKVTSKTGQRSMQASLRYSF